MPFFGSTYNRLSYVSGGHHNLDGNHSLAHQESSNMGSAFPGAWGSFKTPKINSSSSQTATSHILDLYSSGHWGSQPVVIIDIHQVYYRPTWWRLMIMLDFNMTKMYRIGSPILTGSNNAYIELQNSGNTSSTLAVTNNSSSWGSSNNGVVSWTPGNSYVQQVGTYSHSGQSVFRQRINLILGGTYYQGYSIIHLMNGGGSNRAHFLNSSISTANTYYVSNGSGQHLPTVPQPTYYPDTISAGVIL